VGVLVVSLLFLFVLFICLGPGGGDGVAFGPGCFGVWFHF
jgi:hypothetical protein